MVFGSDLLGDLHGAQLQEFELRSRVVPPAVSSRVCCGVCHAALLVGAPVDSGGELAGRPHKRPAVKPRWLRCRCTMPAQQSCKHTHPGRVPPSPCRNICCCATLSPAQELVQSATVHAADLFQMGDTLGRVEKGYAADLLLVDGEGDWRGGVAACRHNAHRCLPTAAERPHHSTTVSSSPLLLFFLLLSLWKRDGGVPTQPGAMLPLLPAIQQDM